MFCSLFRFNLDLISKNVENAIVCCLFNIFVFISAAPIARIWNSHITSAEQLSI